MVFSFFISLQRSSVRRSLQSIRSLFTSGKQAKMTSTAVCKVGDLKNGEMKAFTIGDSKVLLVKEKDIFHAVSNKCTHFGAPLSTGVYCKGTVRCPWHGACFNVVTGDIEDFPGLDSLQKFETRIEKDEVHVVTTPESLATVKRTKPMQKRTTEETVVIIGGGAAGASCAESLRQGGFSGRVRVVCVEASPPYDRTILSKKAGVAADAILLRSADFYKQHDIELVLNTAVTAVNTKSKTVTVAPSGETLPFDHLVIATGGRPRTLSCPGADLDGVHYLRTPADGQRIAALVGGKRVVVIGASFIGMEMAAFAKSADPAALEVTVVGPGEAPLPAFGVDIGNVVRKLHESKGVAFRLNTNVTALEGVDGVLKAVRLSDGSSLPADVCVCGIGVLPSTEFLSSTDVKLDARGYVPVNAQCRTSVASVYACGDIVTFPLPAFALESVNVQHWQIALKHGQIAGAAIAGKSEADSKCDTVPFFWCMTFGRSVRYSGYGPGYDDIVIHGDLDEYKFVAYYLKEGVLRAVATMGRDPVAAMAAELFRNRVRVRKADITKNLTDDWSEWLR